MVFTLSLLLNFVDMAGVVHVGNKIHGEVNKKSNKRWVISRFKVCVIVNGKKNVTLLTYLKFNGFIFSNTHVHYGQL